MGGLGRLGALEWKSPIGPEESSTGRQLRRGKCEGLQLIYAWFHPTIKIMEDGIDSVGDVAMTGLSGWEKREFSLLSFPDAARKRLLAVHGWMKARLYVCAPASAQPLC